MFADLKDVNNVIDIVADMFASEVFLWALKQSLIIAMGSPKPRKASKLIHNMDIRAHQQYFPLNSCQ